MRGIGPERAEYLVELVETGRQRLQIERLGRKDFSDGGRLGGFAPALRPRPYLLAEYKSEDEAGQNEGCHAVPKVHAVNSALVNAFPGRRTARTATARWCAADPGS